MRVGGATTVTGALLASLSDELRLSTASLTVGDVADHDRLDTTGGGLSIGFGNTGLSALAPSIDLEHEAKTGVSRAVIGPGTIEIRDLSIEKAQAILARLERDPAKVQEILASESDALHASLDLVAVARLPENLRAIANLMRAWATPVPEDLTPTQGDYFRRLMAGGLTAEEARAKLADPKVREYVRQKANLDRLEERFGAEGIPSELAVLVLTYHIDVDLLPGDGPWQKRLSMVSGCTVDAGSPCDSAVIGKALADFERNYEAVTAAVRAHVSELATDADTARKLLAGDRATIDRVQLALTTLRYCIDYADGFPSQTALEWLAIPRAEEQASEGYAKAQAFFANHEKTIESFTALTAIVDALTPSNRTRALGALQTAGGMAMVLGGAATAETGAGALAVVIGADQTIAGIRQTISGMAEDTALYQSLQSACLASGMANCEEKAAIVEFAVGVGVGGILSRGGSLKGSLSAAVNDNDHVAVIAGKTCVYSCVVDGETRYVGITDDVIRRGKEHMRTKGILIDEIPGLENLSRADARAVEQTLIDYYGMEKNGGTLLNKINSISPTKDPTAYERAIMRGRELLNQVNYVWGR